MKCAVVCFMLKFKQKNIQYVFVRLEEQWLWVGWFLPCLCILYVYLNIHNDFIVCNLLNSSSYVVWLIKYCVIIIIICSFACTSRRLGMPMPHIKGILLLAFRNTNGLAFFLKPGEMELYGLKGIVYTIKTNISRVLCF